MLLLHEATMSLKLALEAFVCPTTQPEIAESAAAQAQRGSVG